MSLANSSIPEVRFRDWQFSDSLSSRGKYGICHRRHDGGNAMLAKPARRLTASDRVKFHQGHFVHSHHWKVSIGMLFGAAVSECNVPFQRRGEPPSDRAFSLPFESQGIEHQATVYGANDPVYAHMPTIVDGNLRHLGNVRFSKVCVAGNAASPPAAFGSLRKRSCPIGFFGGDFQGPG